MVLKSGSQDSCEGGDARSPARAVASVVADLVPALEAQADVSVVKPVAPESDDQQASSMASTTLLQLARSGTRNAGSSSARHQAIHHPPR